MIFNKTPHEINVVDSCGNPVCSIPLTGEPIRLEMKTEIVGKLGIIPLTKTVFGEPTGLPDEGGGHWYVVSQLVKAALPDRTDLLVPAEMLRDEKGRIVGCQSLGI